MDSLFLQEGFPTIVTVKDVDIISPGINYSTDDAALINGIPVPIVVDNFGRIQSIDPGAGGPIICDKISQSQSSIKNWCWIQR